MRKYFTLTQKTSGEAPLYVQIKTIATGKMKLNTGIKVDVEAYSRPTYFKTAKGRKVEEKLLDFEKALDEALKVKGCTADTVKQAVYNEVHKEEIAKQKQEEEERSKKERAAAVAAAAKKQEEEEERRKDVLAYLNTFIREIRDGSRKHGLEDYSENTVKVWQNFYGILSAYCSVHPFTWSDIDKRLVTDFTNWMDKGGYMVTSINKYLICFRAMVGYAYEDGFHNNIKAHGVFSKKRVNDKMKSREIYLSADELQALFDMNLRGLKQQIRDVFLIGCYTCQRFSDYSRIERDNFKTTKRGNRVIELTQQKTGNEVTIPVLSDNLQKLLEMYDYDIPRVNDVVLNRYIKEILKELSQTVPSLAAKERTNLTMKERSKQDNGGADFEYDDKGYPVKPRYELVSSHTARRTGITLLYLSGKFDIVQMMHVSGHKDTRTFLDYIKLSSEEIADEIARRAREDNDKDIF